LKEHYYKKGLAFVILILFIGTIIFPNISGISEKIVIEKNKILPADYPINTSVNSYWKFDECNGNISKDSSGNGYNGTINGANWTTGYVGCALEFDGIDDYVNYSDYATNYLGFNKTDDLIFSFYFKTLSTDDGIIFSACRGDEYGYNPGFHIGLNSNGTIDFNVWKGYCGFSLCTNESYNDGLWHYAQVIYNGEKYPIVEIYIDNQLDNYIQKWVCPFYADQFKYAEMGRKTDDFTEYFKGIIDEFKIIKYPGGNQQNPPDIIGPNIGEAGVEYNFTFLTNDPEEDDILIFIDKGDGNNTGWLGPFESGEEVNLNFSWSQNGSYIISSKSKDCWGESSYSEQTIRIGDLTPTIINITGPTYGDVGEILTYTFITEDYDEDDIWLFIDWNDSNYEEWIGPFNSGEPVDVSHEWMEKGYFYIKAKAKDEGEEGKWTDPYLVIIGNEAPNPPIINGGFFGHVGVEYDYLFSTIDPEEDEVYYWIEWGDGSNITDYGPYNSGEFISLSHTWKKMGFYTITAWTVDKHGFIGDSSEFKLFIVKNKAIPINFLDLFFKQYPNTFPILRYFLEILVLK
jgi:hypothetical protein